MHLKSIGTFQSKYPSLHYSAIDVAAFIIEECNRRGFDVSHKKLQKLLYFSQGWYLALTKQQIFDENIEAWAHGPVVRKVYDIYRNAGWDNIVIPFRGNSIHVDKNTRYFLGSVLDVYGIRSADELEQITHTEEPWRQARANLPPSETASRAITPESMYEFFSELKQRGSRSKTS